MAFYDDQDQLALDDPTYQGLGGSFSFLPPRRKFQIPEDESTATTPALSLPDPIDLPSSNIDLPPAPRFSAQQLPPPPAPAAPTAVHPPGVDPENLPAYQQWQSDVNRLQTMPKPHVSGWRMALGMAAPRFAPLIMYGPGGMQKIQRRQELEQQIEQERPLAQAEGLAANRQELRHQADVVQAENNAAKQAEQDRKRAADAVDAYKVQVTNLKGIGGELHLPSDPVQPGWTAQQVYNPITSQTEHYHIPSAKTRLDMQARAKQINTITPELEQTLGKETGIKAGMEVSDETFRSLVSFAQAKTKDPSLHIVTGTNELGDQTITAVDPFKGTVVATTTLKGVGQKQSEPLYPVPDPADPKRIIYLPRSEASHRPAARTVFDMQGNPIMGGNFGFSTTPPPTVPSTEQNRIGGFNFALQQANDINDLLNDPAYKDPIRAFGPAAGRIKLAEISKLGGMGASQKQIELANKLQRFLSSQAFADGGKQLTPTELEQFKVVSPAMSDTLATALQKTRDSIKFFQDRLKNDLDVMPVRQRSQIPGVGTPAPSGNGAPSNPASAPPPIPQRLSQTDIGKVYLVNGVAKRITAINPQDPTKFRSEVVQ